MLRVGHGHVDVLEATHDFDHVHGLKDLNRDVVVQTLDAGVLNAEPGDHFLVVANSVGDGRFITNKDAMLCQYCVNCCTNG